MAGAHGHRGDAVTSRLLHGQGVQDALDEHRRMAQPYRFNANVMMLAAGHSDILRLADWASYPEHPYATVLPHRDRNAARQPDGLVVSREAPALGSVSEVAG
jgi:hypothetical protein